LDIPFTTVEVELESREAAHNWLIDNQLGRRNLTPEAVSYLRGKRYQLEKRQGERSDLTCAHFEHKLDVSKTADKLAQQYKVGQATIRRDAQFANAVDSLSGTFGDGIKETILSRGASLSKKDTLELAKIATTEGGEVAQAYLERAINKCPRRL